VAHPAAATLADPAGAARIPRFSRAKTGRSTGWEVAAGRRAFVLFRAPSLPVALAPAAILRRPPPGTPRFAAGARRTRPT